MSAASVSDLDLHISVVGAATLVDVPQMADQSNQRCVCGKACTDRSSFMIACEACGVW